MSIRTRTTVTELLNYFGRCPRCGYPASARVAQHQYSDGTSEREIIATCGLPCGWSGPVPMRSMTGLHA
ncbi:hypothetical protein [Nocardia stercoris]|uniref:Uncharacterized protein n=1 Tax=Nocardia stercoris TaxID=2483361 RepID=A0A3M2KWH6_9NOCA|nr:hypothetical protein [Nocardia stercoris]RMI28810.1 hypothetical protein EBN03_28430 [Nocardia stercoris]